MTDADAVHHSVGVVVVAAGSGTRLRAGRPKAFVELAGSTLLARALEGALAGGASALAVVVPDELIDEARAIVDLVSGDLVAGDRRVTTAVVAGGAERTDSVRAGLAALGSGYEIVLVHDAARCLTPVAVFERVIAAVAAGAAGAVPGIPVIDTVKTVDARGVITGTPDRSALRAVQTPQGFAAEILRAAYAAGLRATDDAALVEMCGHEVVVVDGDPLAFKITTTDDLERARALVAEEDR
ncbi:MAG: 2-C-methyl-D-erythritol 4-phosphate cytidylyltransferase [Dermatophilaceae bacterium]